MLKAIKVDLVKHDESWRAKAQHYSNQLLGLGPIIIKVHHIGSTAIPGLQAKPIIDLLSEVASLDEADKILNRVEAIGYQSHGEYGIPERRYCTFTDANGARVAQLHIFETGSPHILRHLAFRDYLCANKNIAREYETEKQRARDLYPNNSHHYSDEKSAWIKNIEMKALAWYSKP